MSRQVKDLMIGEIRERLGECRDVLVVDSSKLDAVSDNRLRLALNQQGIQLMQVKNTLARLAFESGGAGSLEHCLKGPSTLIWGGEDAVALSKEIAKWAKELEPLVIKGATIDGQALDAAAVDALSKSPGRIELLGQISGLMLSPGARLAAALLGPGGRLQGQLKTLSEKEGTGADDVEAVAEAQEASA